MSFPAPEYTISPLECVFPVLERGFLHLGRQFPGLGRQFQGREKAFSEAGGVFRDRGRPFGRLESGFQRLEYTKILAERVFEGRELKLTTNACANVASRGGDMIKELC